MLINSQEWLTVEETHDINMKVQILDSMLKENFHTGFLVKTSKVSTDNSPWCNNKVILLRRLMCSEFNKQ